MEYDAVKEERIRRMLIAFHTEMNTQPDDCKDAVAGMRAALEAYEQPVETVVEIPTKIRVLAFDFKIEHWHPHSTRGKFGEFSSLEALIKVDFSTDKINALDTLLHEINHAIYWCYGMDDEDKEERVVSAFTGAWVQIYRDNPWLLEFVKDSLK